MSKKPLIGVTPLYDYNLSSWWIVPGYLEGIQKQGGLAILLPFGDSEADAEELVSRLDGVIITGGPDVNPQLYGEEPILQLGLLAAKRDVNERLIYEAAKRQDKPVLGICRGHQFINVMEGGTLYQDLPTQLPTETRHSQRKPSYVMTHFVDIIPDTPLHAWTGGLTELEVNSFHHQAIKDLAPTLKAMAISRGDGIVEATYDPQRRFCVGLQWHPELAFRDHPVHALAFKALVDACR